MPFAVAMKAGADGQRTADFPPRGFFLPTSLASGQISPQIEMMYRFVSLSQTAVENALMKLETRNSLIELAETHGFIIRKSKGKASIVSEIAMELCKPFTEAELKEMRGYGQEPVEPEPENDVEEEEHTIPKDIIQKTLKIIPVYDQLLMTNWLLASLEGDGQKLVEANQAIVSEGTEALNASVAVLASIREKSLLEGFLYQIYKFARNNGASGYTTSNDGAMNYTVHLADATEQTRTCTVLMETGIGKARFTVFFNPRNTGNDLYQYFIDEYGIEKNDFVLKFAGFESGGSTLHDYDTLWTYVAGSTIYFRLNQSGGAKKMPVQKKMKKSEYYNAIMENFRKNYVPKTISGTDFIEKAKLAVARFSSSTGGLDSFKTAIEEMPLVNLKTALDTTASNVGGSTEMKLKNLSHLLFNGVTEALELKKELDMLLEGVELAVICSYYQSQENNGTKFAEIREHIRCQYNRKLGASEASESMVP